jgi:hypothetical protein
LGIYNLAAPSLHTSPSDFLPRFELEKCTVLLEVVRMKKGDVGFVGYVPVCLWMT